MTFPHPHLSDDELLAVVVRLAADEHVRPFANGGPSTADNIELRCRAHNQYEADLFFGHPLTVRERPGPYDMDSVRTESGILPLKPHHIGTSGF
jgi:hypothetical protein